MVWIYNWDQRRGKPWRSQVGGCRDWGQRLCRNRRRLYLKSAGELELLRDMRGNGETQSQWEVIVEID